MRRRPILIAADAGRFVAIGSIPLAHALGMLHLGQLYVVAFIFGTGTVFFDVAYLAYLPALVPRDRLVEGNAKLEVSRSGAQLAGPGIAGVLVQALSAPGAMLADAVSFLASVASLGLVRTKEPPVAPEAGGPVPMRRQIVEGLRYVRHQPLIGPLVVCVAILNFFSMMGEAVLLLFAVRRLGLSAGAIGVILSVGSVGFVVGALVAERLPRVFGIGPALLGTAFMVGLGAVFIPLSTRRHRPLPARGLRADLDVRLGGVLGERPEPDAVGRAAPSARPGLRHAPVRLVERQPVGCPGRRPPGQPPRTPWDAVAGRGRPAGGLHPTAAVARPAPGSAPRPRRIGAGFHSATGRRSLVGRLS